MVNLDETVHEFLERRSVRKPDHFDHFHEGIDGNRRA